MRVRAAKQEKIAIRRSARDLNGSDYSAGTTAVLDDERSELTHSLRPKPSNDVVRPAGG
jgi:hypothetical protein